MNLGGKRHRSAGSHFLERSVSGLFKDNAKDRIRLTVKFPVPSIESTPVVAEDC